eukprot:TRINITY_DN5634_c0_g1_i2.p1 TRINITY_DN5634_c0_g1~~TRINITY_DN5634_c0_g1_i2.p1  ORF type:complete len:781 (-),score=204.76 TRINITY_DN5634_c0_g1_i2:340-2682(-)
MTYRLLPVLAILFAGAVFAQTCFPVQKGGSQTWALAASLAPVSGCSVSNAVAVASVTITESGHNVAVNMVHNLGAGARASITQGEQGAELFAIPLNADGTGSASFNGISDAQFNQLVSNNAWIRVSNDACPNGVLAAQLLTVPCPIVPVIAVLDGAQVVGPLYAPMNFNGLMIGTYNTATRFLNIVTIHTITGTPVIAGGIFGPAPVGQNADFLLFMSNPAQTISSDMLGLTAQQEQWLLANLLFIQIQDQPNRHIRGQIRALSCVECGAAPPAPSPSPVGPIPCVPVGGTKTLSFTAKPVPVAGCASAAGAMALASLTWSATAQGNNLQTNVVQSLGSSAQVVVTSGNNGPEMFRFPVNADGSGSNVVFGVSDSQSFTLTSNQGWMVITTAECPNGALIGPITVAECPLIPVMAVLDGAQVVAPYTPMDFPGLMVGAFNQQTGFLSIMTAHLITNTTVIAGGLFGPAQPGQNAEFQLFMSRPDLPLSSDTLGLTSTQAGWLLSNQMFIQIQDQPDRHIRGQIIAMSCADCVNQNPPVTPPVNPPPASCPPATGSEVFWMYASGTVLSGCASANNANYLAAISFEQASRTLRVSMLSNAADVTRVTIETGQNGAEMFRITQNAAGAFSGEFASVTEEQFNALASGNGFLTVYTSGCPNGALSSQIMPVVCPLVPVVAVMNGAQVVAPYTPMDFPGLMVGAFDASARNLTFATMHLISGTQVIAGGLFGPAPPGQNAEFQLFMSNPQNQFSTDSLGLTEAQSGWLTDNLMFIQIQDQPDRT